MPRNISLRVKGLGLKGLRRTALAGLVLVSSVSASLVWDPSSAFAATGSWSATGSMTIDRGNHTATLLPSGKVLVAGGENFSRVLASAEVYEPATGTWSATGSMALPRYEHTATLLSSGKVLVAGGLNAAQVPVASAELYDSATGTWSATGSMTTPRVGQTATLLSSGKVLVTGGANVSPVFTTAELYDPATGTWSATGSMTIGRANHTATLLPGGKVLVAGGLNTAQVRVASAELYDPATGTWSATGSMTIGRDEYTATLLPSGKVLVVGGLGCCSVLGTAELYDPLVGTWSTTGSMVNPSFVHTATLLPNGKVLVAGGIHEGCCPVASAELYDSATGIWSASVSMTTPRVGHTAMLLPNGKVLVAGGSNMSVLATAELYNPAGLPVPSCGLTRTGTNGSGHTFIDITVQDPSSGLRVVQVTESNNASVVVPTFGAGTTSPLVVAATKIDQTKTSQVALQVTNVAGQVTNCDPILTEVGRDGPHGVPRAETFHHVAQGESQVTISNGTPGLRRLRLVVDGHAFEVTGLTDGETRLVDVSSAMRRGDNTITLIAQGKSEGTADILIADK